MSWNSACTRNGFWLFFWKWMENENETNLFRFKLQLIRRFRTLFLQSILLLSVLTCVITIWILSGVSRPSKRVLLMSIKYLILMIRNMLRWGGVDWIHWMNIVGSWMLARCIKCSTVSIQWNNNCWMDWIGWIWIVYQKEYSNGRMTWHWNEHQSGYYYYGWVV